MKHIVTYDAFGEIVDVIIPHDQSEEAVQKRAAEVAARLLQDDPTSQVYIEERLQRCVAVEAPRS